MLNHPQLLVSLSESEKRVLLILFIVLTAAFLLFGLLVKGIKMWAEGKAAPISEWGGGSNYW